MSDNGGYATGTHWRDAPLYTQNAPLRCGKGSAYEGGVREPMIVKWNGVAQPGSTQDAYLLIEDYFPSLLDIAGIKGWRVPQKVDGRSFVPLLRGGKGDNKRALIWNCPNIWDNSGPGIGATCTIRLGNWKLV